jgi:hypothetical protein
MDFHHISFVREAGFYLAQQSALAHAPPSVDRQDEWRRCSRRNKQRGYAFGYLSRIQKIAILTCDRLIIQEYIWALAVLSGVFSLGHS